MITGPLHNNLIRNKTNAKISKRLTFDRGQPTMSLWKKESDPAAKVPQTEEIAKKENKFLNPKFLGGLYVTKQAATIALAPFVIAAWNACELDNIPDSLT